MRFPTTSILDSGTRANENPLSDGGKWSSFAAATNQLQISSNEIVGTAGASALNGNYWNAFTLSTNKGEVFGTIATKAIVTNDFVAFSIADSSGSNGYDVVYLENTTGTDSVIIEKLTGGTPSPLATFSQEITAGDSIGLSVNNGTLTAWYKSGSGAWTSLGSTTDATYSVSGMNLFIVLEYTSTSEGITNFGGGNPVSGIMNLKTGWWGDI